MPAPTPVRCSASWIAALIATALAATALSACSFASDPGEAEPDDEAPRIRAGIGIDGVAYVGDPKDDLPGGIDDVEVDGAAGSVTYLYDDASGDTSREVELCTATDRVRAVRLRDTPENQEHVTPEGIRVSSSQAEVEAVLGTPFGDGFVSGTGWYVLQYEGPLADTWIAFAYPDGDRSRMVRVEVFGPPCS